MNYFLVVFRARSETMKFGNILNSYNLPVSYVNTPRQISVSCGISAKINVGAIDVAKIILNRRQFYTFAGIYYYNNGEYVLV